MPDGLHPSKKGGCREWARCLLPSLEAIWGNGGAAAAAGGAGGDAGASAAPAAAAGDGEGKGEGKGEGEGEGEVLGEAASQAPAEAAPAAAATVPGPSGGAVPAAPAAGGGESGSGAPAAGLYPDLDDGPWPPGYAAQPHRRDTSGMWETMAFTVRKARPPDTGRTRPRVRQRSSLGQCVEVGRKDER